MPFLYAFVRNWCVLKDSALGLRKINIQNWQYLSYSTIDILKFNSVFALAQILTLTLIKVVDASIVREHLNRLVCNAV